MTDKGDYMITSEIRARLQHRSTAVTRAWIRDRGLEEKGIDLNTRENQYSRSEVEAAIESTVQRGPYNKSRPPADGARDDDGVQPEH